MDSHLGAAIHEELRAIRAMLETDASLGEESPPPAEDLHTTGFLTGSLASVQPNTVQAFTLWQLFLERVNPLTKVIHIPSVQPYITEEASGIGAIPLNYQALRFAIFTLATVSMSESESQQKIGCSRQDAIRDYTQGTEIALRKLNVMKNFDMVALQALVLYLLSLRNRHGKDTSWILTGTALRMAIKMGYHRDGELLGLSPFETEMRRRIWWHLMLQDVTHTLTSSLSCSETPVSWDCKMPQNLNDADLFPGSVDALKPHETPTEMGFCLIGYQLAKSILSLECLRGTAGLEIATIWNTEDVAGNPLASSIRQKYMEDLDALDQALLDVERRYVFASAGKVHAAALSLRRLLVSKGRELMTPMMEQPERGTEIFTVQDNLFKILIIKNEMFTGFDEAMDSAGFLCRNQSDALRIEPGVPLRRYTSEKIAAVGQIPNKAELERDPLVRVFEGRGRTLMSCLGDGHTHFTWNGGDLNRLGELDVEEHVLLTIKSAQCFLDSGYTICFRAAAAKDRLDVVVRDAINTGDIPGPQYLANAREIAKPERGLIVAGITWFADGPQEMCDAIKYNVETIGVDNVKLSISGEEITDIRSAQVSYFSDEAIIACVDEAHKRQKRVCAHARARDSVKMCVKHGVDVIYHGSYVDDEGMHAVCIDDPAKKVGMDMLERDKDKNIVVPAINWLYATTYEADAFGYTYEAAEKAGYKRELDIAVAGLREMHRRGIVVLPGGDYGFAWTPHGTYARDLEHFVKMLGFTPHESIIAATAGVAALMMRGHELGKIQPGYYADCILVDGDPLEDISILQDHDKINVIIMNGRVHKAGRKEYIRDTSGSLSTGIPRHLTEDFPEKRPATQKSY
ncbi:hypothetical protein CEP53_012969 [Fusarium sp. AF-6]|nr:hypothetical protein CEP53_012969 [Fusarium sp. AF-6]